MVLNARPRSYPLPERRDKHDRPIPPPKDPEAYRERLLDILVQGALPRLLEALGQPKEAAKEGDTP